MSTKQSEPLPDDNDTKRITAHLNTSASALNIGQEAYRLCRINALLRADLKKVRAELRSSKQKQAVMEDALEEMRAELPPTQDLLDRLWKVVPKKKISPYLKAQYTALRDGDSFDFQPEYRQPKAKDTRDGLRSSREQRQGGKHTPATGEGTTTFLVHMHDGEAYDMKDNNPIGGNNEEDDNDDNIAPSINVQPREAAASTDIVTARKRRAVEQDGNITKKVKSGNDSIIAGGVIARSIAGMKRKRTTETMATALEKQEVGKNAAGQV